MKEMIIIDPGHGGKDFGAIRNGLKEKDVTLDIAMRLRKKLINNGFAVGMTRETDVYRSPTERADDANNTKAELLISIHCNAEAGSTATGTEILIYNDDIQNFLIASHLEIGMNEFVNLRDRGIKERSDLIVLNSTEMTAAIVECAFLSNPDDAEKLKDTKFLNNIANAIHYAICQYFEVAFIEDAAEETEANPTVMIPTWQSEAFKQLVGKGIITTQEYWEGRLSESITVGEVFGLLANL